MNFLLDEDLPRSCAEVIRSYRHEASRVVEIGLRGHPDTDVARYAQEHCLCMVTGDFGFSDLRNYPPNQYSGIVVLELPPAATAKSITNLLDTFLQQTECLDQIHGKLAIVSPAKIRLRSSL